LGLLLLLFYIKVLKNSRRRTALRYGVGVQLVRRAGRRRFVPEETHPLKRHPSHGWTSDALRGPKFGDRRLQSNWTGRGVQVERPGPSSQWSAALVPVRSSGTLESLKRRDRQAGTGGLRQGRLRRVCARLLDQVSSRSLDAPDSRGHEANSKGDWRVLTTGEI
jgi:hypothetical protein